VRYADRGARAGLLSVVGKDVVVGARAEGQRLAIAAACVACEGPGADGEVLGVRAVHLVRHTLQRGRGPCRREKRARPGGAGGRLLPGSGVGGGVGVKMRDNQWDKVQHKPRIRNLPSRRSKWP
jgi:hypothetical protein